jgi:hypothetical protein
MTATSSAITTILQTLTNRAAMPHVGQPELIDWQGHDPVALTAAAWRLHTANPNSVPKYQHDLLSVGQITPEDTDLARRIRDYYQQQILMQVLAGRELTDFRRKLYNFLAGGYQLMSADIGLLHKLPHFYHHDQDLVRVVEQSVAVPGPTIRFQCTMTLTPLLVTESHEVRTRGMQYWWLNESQEAVRFDDGFCKALTTLLGGLHRRGQGLTFYGDFRTLQKPLTMGNHMFWDVVSVELVP